MVDSNLLRFLGKQKRLQQSGQLTAADVQELLQQQQLTPTDGYLTSLDNETNSDCDSANDDTATITPFAEKIPAATENTLLLDTDASSQPLPLDETPAQGQTGQQQQQQQLDHGSASSWLGQYNRYRVASVLVGEDGQQVEESLALAAGERVQSQALSRTARRRVREFLKERDRAWTASTEDSTSDGTSNSGAAAAAAGNGKPQSSSKAAVEPVIPSYGMQDVVDMFLSYGFTAKDIAEIFIHSPGVALMRPRPKRVSAATITFFDGSNDTDTRAITTDDNGNDNVFTISSGNGETLQETVDRVFVNLLQGTLKLRKYDARKVIRNCPALLTMRGSRSAEHIIVLLQQLGVSTNSIARDKNALPTLLSRSPAAIFRLIAFLSSDAVRMPMNKIGPLLRRSECQELLDTVAPVPAATDSSSSSSSAVSNDHMETYNDDGATDPGVVSALWGRSSQIRRERINDIYRNMTATAWTIRHEIGTEDLGKVIAAYPNVLLLDAEHQILPVAHYLMEELGVWEDDLPRVLQLYPALLGMQVSQMKSVASYLLELEVAPETLSSIFRSFPALLTLNVENDMGAVVDFLRTTVGISNLGRFVSRLPPILGYSVPNELEPKWEFLQSIVTDARFELSRFPAYFSYPLERVKTRFQYLRQVKRLPRQLLSLDQVLRWGDKDFATKIARDVDNGVAFREFAQECKRKRQPTVGATNKSKQRKQKPRRKAPCTD